LLLFTELTGILSVVWNTKL